MHISHSSTIQEVQDKQRQEEMKEGIALDGKAVAFNTEKSERFRLS